MTDRFDKFFGGLQSHLAILEQHRVYTNQYIGDGLNIFDFIGYDENNLSDVIKRLLDPAGGHGQGTVFLSNFLNLAAAKSTRGGLESAFTRIAQAVLRQERVSIKREHGTTAGRSIDIVGYVGQFRFAIENKPRAGDLDEQVSHYIKDLKHSSGDNWAFMYLKGYGSSPSPKSLPQEQRCELLASGHYVEWDYSGDLAEWIQRCEFACQADKVRWFMRDFRSYVLREFGSILHLGKEDAG